MDVVFIIILSLFYCQGFEGVTSPGRPKEKFTVSTPFSVARAKWRPSHKHHISRSFIVYNTCMTIIASIKKYTTCTKSESPTPKD